MNKQIRIACKGHSTLALNKFEPFQGKLKKLSNENYEKLKKSILDLGFSEPCSVWLDPEGKYKILNSHQRVLTLKRMRDKEEYEVPALPISLIEAKTIKEAKKKILALTAQFGEMTKDGLKEFMVEADLKFDDVKDFRFPEVDLESFAPEDETNNSEGEDDIPEVSEKCHVKLGDLFLLGDHRLYCGDSTNKECVDLLMDGENVDLLLTDPPYGIDVVKSDGNVGGNRKNGKVGFANAGKYGAKASCRTYKSIIGDDKPFDPTFLTDLGDNQIIFGANNFASNLPDNSHWIVWDKKMPEKNDFSDAELAWTSFNKKIVKTFVFGWAGMIREGPRKDELENRVHPTQKPVGLFENILNYYDTYSILDLFGGSGSTLIACEKTNRKCMMMELDPHYIEIIIERFIKYSNKDVYRVDPKNKKTKWSDIKK